MKKEIRHLKGFEGTHLISSDGKLFRKSRRTGDIVECPQFVTKPGYVIVNLQGQGDKTQRSYYFQKLMMENFDTIRDKEEWVITHIDGNKENNSIDNLKWIRREDMKTGPRGDIIEVYDTSTGEVTEFPSITQAAQAFGTNTVSIRKLIAGGKINRQKYQNKTFKEKK